MGMRMEMKLNMERVGGREKMRIRGGWEWREVRGESCEEGGWG